MSVFLVLVANEPRAYREIIAELLAMTRPHLNTISIEPTSLDESIRHLSPSLVLCNRVTERLIATMPAWIMLYPEGASFAVASFGGRQRTMPDLDLDHLLALIDESATSARSFSS